MTLRDNTEWVETIDIGANRLAGCEPLRISRAVKEALAGPRAWGSPFGAGDAAEKIVAVIEERARVIRGSVRRTCGG